jgi:hypothetical protein
MKPKRPVESAETTAAFGFRKTIFTAASTEELFLQPLACYGNLNN